MPSLRGGLHRALQAVLFQTALYGILLLCTTTILGIYSYFVFLSLDHSIHITAWTKAVETVSCAATIYLVFACLATLCLGGRTIVAIAQIIVDVAFSICMIATSIMTRDGADSCKGRVKTPLGTGSANNSPVFEKVGLHSEGGQSSTSTMNLGRACRLNTVVFVLSMIAAVLFLCTATMQVVLKRYHEAERSMSASSVRSDSPDSSLEKFESSQRRKWHAQDSRRPNIAPRQWYV